MYKNNIAVCKVLAGIVLAAALYTFPAGADVLYSENSALVSVEDRANLLSDSDEHKLLQLAENLLMAGDAHFTINGCRVFFDRGHAEKQRRSDVLVFLPLKHAEQDFIFPF